MVVGPETFLWLSVLSIILIFSAAGFTYVVCCNFSTYRNSRSCSKKLTNAVQLETNNNTVSEPRHDVSNPPISSITGPQGHGFYTSGPWKIDLLSQDIALQFAQSHLMMANYFGQLANSAPVEEDTTDSGEPVKPTYDLDPTFNEILMGDRSTGNMTLGSGYGTYGYQSYDMDADSDCFENDENVYNFDSDACVGLGFM